MQELETGDWKCGYYSEPELKKAMRLVKSLVSNDRIVSDLI
jgi:hypothetical protein